MDTAANQFVATVKMSLEEYKELLQTIEEYREEAEYFAGKIERLTQDVYELEQELEACRHASEQQ